MPEPRVLVGRHDQHQREDEPPHATVTQVGRWRYRITIRHGLMVYGPDGYGWHRYGQRRADAKARRELHRYLLRQEREAQTWMVKP